MNCSKILFSSLLALLLASYGCGPADDDTTLTPELSIRQDLDREEGWLVTYYLDNGQDETTDFSGWTFYFRNSGIVDAENDSTTVRGSWQAVVDDNQEKLIISFTDGTEPLDDIDDDWVIVSRSDTKIELEDDNEDDPEQLHFSAR